MNLCLYLRTGISAEPNFDFSINVSIWAAHNFIIYTLGFANSLTNIRVGKLSVRIYKKI